MPRHGALTTTEQQMLGLEQGYFKYLGAKHEQILAVLKMSPTTYYQRLNELIDTPEAQRWDPLTCRRLQRLRDKRRDARTVGFDA